MISHQAVRMKRAFVLDGELAKDSEIQQEVARLIEAPHAVIAALDDVKRYSRKHKTRLTRHNATNEPHPDLVD